MSDRTWHGYWWLPEAPEDRQPGVLSVDDDGSSQLELIGGFDLNSRSELAPGVFTVGVGDKTVPVIHGTAEGEPISLLDCFTRHSRGPFFDRPAFHRLHVNRVLTGVHAAASASREFLSADVEIENLTTWLRLPAIWKKTDWSAGGASSAELRLVDPIEVDIDGWTYVVAARYRPFELHDTKSRHVIAGNVTAFIKITPSEAKSVREFDRAAMELTDLLTLAAGVPCGALSLKLRHEQTKQVGMRGEDPVEMPIYAEAFGERIHPNAPDADATKIHKFLFTCSDSPFAELLKAWVPVRRAAAEACNVYFGLHYGRPKYTENRVLLLAIVAEALHSRLYGEANDLPADEFEALRDEILRRIEDDAHRSWVKEKLRNSPSLRERLRHLASVPKASAVAALIPDVEDWAGKVVRARNNLAHTGGHEITDLFPVEWVTRGLLALFLMERLGLSEEVQLRAAEDVLRLDV